MPLALAACATTGTASKKPVNEGPKLVVQPAQTVNTAPPLQRPKSSPYAAAQEDPSKRGDYVAGGLFRPGEADTVPDYVPDVDAIPEPEVRAEPRSRAGNKSYSVLGKRYHVLDSAHGYAEEGLASYYGKKFHGRRTSNQEVYDMYAFTAAHKSLPLPSFARVTNLDNGRSVVVRVNDRGPFHAGRVIDLSYAAAVKLGYRDRGTARVRVEALTEDDGGDLLASRAPPAADTAMDKLVEQLPQALASAGPVAPAPQARPAADSGYRFDMQQDGKVMSADEFDAWMQSRRVRVATGKPGRPDPQPASTDAKASTAAPAAVAPPPPSPVNAAALVAASSVVPAAAADEVTLQVASFANQQNARHALSMLQGASIAQARLLDADVNGKKIWRLRIGPVAAAHAPELAARIVGLGFGQPQRVRD
ncbi:septal ring lytic transglycosylase RlpA family protein [Thermomonas sp.]|uniref:septal ring lytic transglycosylase RlpA family protein n=1 Tax=Thermomonas sp. TaxID=1971895 RepID=UPI0035AE5213